MRYLKVTSIVVIVSIGLCFIASKDKLASIYEYAANALFSFTASVPDLPTDSLVTTSPITGSWVYNAGECDDKITLDSIYEISFSGAKGISRAGNIDTSSQGFEIHSATSDDNALVDIASRSIINCKNLNVTDEQPYIARYKLFALQRTFVLYPKSKILIEIDNDDGVIFRPLSRIRALKSIPNSRAELAYK